MDFRDSNEARASMQKDAENIIRETSRHALLETIPDDDERLLDRIGYKQVVSVTRRRGLIY